MIRAITTTAKDYGFRIAAHAHGLEDITRLQKMAFVMKDGVAYCGP